MCRGACVARRRRLLDLERRTVKVGDTAGSGGQDGSVATLQGSHLLRRRTPQRQAHRLLAVAAEQQTLSRLQYLQNSEALPALRVL